MQSKNKLPTSSYRIDIQVLRGLAVLLVMCYHANFYGVTRGFLGVDIFFVISGFLITKIILHEMANKQFSFKGFYLRRARRLLPAAYTVFVITAIASAFLLSTPRLVSLLVQLVGGLTFTANLVFFESTNYFAGSSELLPLLHIWSLSLEEQFYLILPILLLLVAQRFRPLLIVVLLFMSMCLCFFVFQFDSSMAFYLLPARAWELLLGSVLASSLLPNIEQFKYKEYFAFLMLVIITYCVVLGFSNDHPGIDALLVCLATAVLISFKSRLLNVGLHSRFFSKVGDISYALYLIHWPLLALARNVYIDNAVPTWLYVTLFFLSFPMAYLIYSFVEKPFREGQRWGHCRIRYMIVLTMILSLLPIAFAIYMNAVTTHKDWNFIRRVNFGISSSCEYETTFHFKKECATTNKPDVLVWGDSYAMHLLPGLIKQYPDVNFMQATRSACAPNLYIAQVNKAYTMAWAESCLSFNQSVIDYLKLHPVKYVILAARMNQYEGDVYLEGNIRSLDNDVLIKSYQDTLLMIRQLGIVPIFIAPPPVNGVDIGECLEKTDTGSYFLSRQLLPHCGVSLSSYLDYQSRQITIIEGIAALTAVKVIKPADILCDDSQCISSLSGIPLYRDDGHYTVSGSEVLFSKLPIFE